MSTPANNSPPSQAEESKEKQELHWNLNSSPPSQPEKKKEKQELDRNSNNSPPSEPEEKRGKQEFHTVALPAEDAEPRGVKRSNRERGEGNMKKLKRRNYRATLEENIELARAWLEKGNNDIATPAENMELMNALFEMHDQLDDYGMSLNQYDSLWLVELVPKLKKDVVVANRARDPTDELWAVPNEIRGDIDFSMLAFFFLKKTLKAKSFLTSLI